MSDILEDRYGSIFPVPSTSFLVRCLGVSGLWMRGDEDRVSPRAAAGIRVRTQTGETLGA